MIANANDIKVAENGDFSLSVSKAGISKDFLSTGSGVTVSITMNS